MSLGRVLWVAAVFAVSIGSAAAADWPEFRGPAGDGVVPPAVNGGMRGFPLQWSETENVDWKTPIPEQGWSTPVVNGDQIWLTHATLDGHDYFVMRVNADTGEIEFHEKLFHSDNPEPLGNNVNCYASPSPAIEGDRAYIHFGSYGTACIDTTTNKVIWMRDDLPCRHFRGPGSSVFLYKDLVVLTFDGADYQYVAALDKKTGKTVWKTDRTTDWPDLDENGQPKREGDFRKAYSTPFLIQANGKDQLFIPGSYCGFAYDPETGEEIWKVHYPGYTSSIRPVYADGLVYVSTGRGQTEMWAVRTDGKGDVTNTHVAWKAAHPHMPLTPSPLLIDGLLYLVGDKGSVICLDAKTGEEVWTQRIGGSYIASPIYADGRIYCFSVQGATVVLKPGREAEVLGTSRLEEGFMASPAVHNDAFILRSKTHLYRISEHD